MQKREPTFDVRDRCGLSTSTRNMIKKIWPVKLPKMDPEMLARLVFCFENNPERHDGIISGAQDAIGICVPGLARHYYNNNFWPEKIESTQDEMTLRFLEQHLVMIPLEPRRPGCSVVEGKDIDTWNIDQIAVQHSTGTDIFFSEWYRWQRNRISAAPLMDSLRSGNHNPKFQHLSIRAYHF